MKNHDDRTGSASDICGRCGTIEPFGRGQEAWYYITLIRLLELGLGFGVLSREIAEPLIHENKLVSLNQGRSYKIPFALAWYPRREMPDYFREIVQMIK
jgi:DNA-binding transcriptional LysR family regulator